MELAALPDRQLEMQEVLADPAVIPDTYRWLALALVVVVVLILFALAVRRLRATAPAAVDEVRESILTTDLLQQQLASLWERWFGRRQAGDPFLSLAGEEETRRRIRLAYQHLLAAATAIGQGRRPGATPTEYQAELQLPAAEAAQRLSALTAAYHQARYAPDPPTPEEAASAQQAWQQIEQQMAAQQPTAASAPQ